MHGARPPVGPFFILQISFLIFRSPPSHDLPSLNNLFSGRGFRGSDIEFNPEAVSDFALQGSVVVAVIICSNDDLGVRVFGPKAFGHREEIPG